MPPALPFEPYRGAVWRVIEGQYRPATRKIVDTLAEQAALEEILEGSKPPVPPECAHLDYQFVSPFRYSAYPGWSRFRRRGRTPGVYYAAEAVLTAAIETAWNAIKFYRASPRTGLPAAPTTHTAIEAEIAAPVAIDLTDPAVAPLGDFLHPTDYAPCQAFADRVRGDGCTAIRYQSVRDPRGGRNLAVLACRAFVSFAPTRSETWHIFLKADRVQITNETRREDHEFLIHEQRLALLGEASA